MKLFKRKHANILTRKSQSGVNAAILVAIISVLIIIYIIFLPEGERKKLLEDKPSKSGKSEEVSESIILKVFPGTLSSVAGVEEEKDLPNVFLVEITNAKELVTINPFVVSRSLFDKKLKTEEFTLDDSGNIDNVILSFNAKIRKGTLVIKLNGNAVYENEITNNIIEPIKLNRNALTKKNTLEFSVSSPGTSFWRTNKYSLENIRVIGDITDRTKQESQNIFALTDTELKNLEKASLKFIPYCRNIQNVGTLDILINNKKIFSAVPICDDPYKQTIPTGALREEDNTAVFRTNKGSYSVEQITVNLEFKEPRAKTYFFEINASEFSAINQSKKNAVLNLKFVDDLKEKRLVIDINGHKESTDVNRSTYSKIINSKIEQGNNFVRLTPTREDIDVVELNVELTKK